MAGGSNLPPFSSLHMFYYHLNAAQRKFIEQWSQDNLTRPSFGAYDKASRKIAKIPTASKPPIKSIASTRPGYNARQLVPTSRFNALKHLPPGWAIASDYDGGGNFRLHNAGGLMLANLWNCWSSRPGGALDECVGLLASRLRRQLEANSVEI